MVSSLWVSVFDGSWPNGYFVLFFLELFDYWFNELGIC